MRPKFELFYVYEHWRPDKDVCFYVGKGCGKRAKRFKRGKHYNNVVGKLYQQGMCVEVRMVADGLTEEDAYKIEIEQIAFWRKLGVKLTNQTDGGDGVRGRDHSAFFKALHADPKIKIKHRKAVIEALARPETKLRHRAASSESQRRIGAKTSLRMKLVRASNPEKEAIRNQRLRETLSTAEVKELKRSIMLEVRSRPGMEEKITSGIRAAMQRPEVIAKLGLQTLGSRWANDGKANRRLRPDVVLPDGWSYGKKRP